MKQIWPSWWCILHNKGSCNSLYFVIHWLVNHEIIKIWKRHLSIVDKRNYCEAPFRAGCQPLFVLAGCHLLDYSSFLREGPNPCLLLQPSQRRILPHPCPPASFCTSCLSFTWLLQLSQRRPQPLFITPAFSEKGTPSPLPTRHFSVVNDVLPFSPGYQLNILIVIFFEMNILSIHNATEIQFLYINSISLSKIVTFWWRQTLTI